MGHLAKKCDLRYYKVIFELEAHCIKTAFETSCNVILQMGGNRGGGGPQL